MNNGKICVSVCAETADEFINKITQAAAIADVIELRFDCLKKNEIERVWKSKASHLPEITTFRPKEQGGKRLLDADERFEFWQSGYQTLWCDFETDLFDIGVTLRPEVLICSHHDFVETPKNLFDVYKRIVKLQPEIIKIAVQTNSIADSISIWSLLDRAISEDKKLIPIAMGEAGKWTRILGLAHAAPLTYASLEEGDETAPGQISASDLIDIYRVKELNEQTQIYGIIGNPVSHSASPYLHNAAFKHHSLNKVYIPFEVNNLQEFFNVMVKHDTREVELNFRGLSVTAPHKESVMEFLDTIDETATQIGAVNTISIVDDKLHGYNTDADAFIEPLKEQFPYLHDAKVAIIGSGGAANAAIYALQQAQANATVFTRNPSIAMSSQCFIHVEVELISQLESKSADFDIVVNCTPLGTKGELEEKTPLRAEQLKNVQLVYDLVYNPIETVLLHEAKLAGTKVLNGLDMLLAQAAKQFEIWTDLRAPKEQMTEAALNRLKQ